MYLKLRSISYDDDEDEEIDVTVRLVNFELEENSKSSRVVEIRQQSWWKSPPPQVVARIDLSLDITSASLYAYLKCPLIGFVAPRQDSTTTNARYKLMLPDLSALKKSAKSRKNSAANQAQVCFKLNFFNSSSSELNDLNFLLISLFKSHEIEQKHLMENLLRFLTLDEQTGALFLNITEQSELFLFSKWSKLRKFYLYERNTTSKLVKIDVINNSQPNNNNNNSDKFSVYIELMFARSSPSALPSARSGEYNHHRNEFVINGNNLLSMLRHGDEFVLAMSVDENSATWLEPIVSVREYLRTSVLRNRKQSLHFEMIKDSLRFYLIDNKDSYFR